MCKNKYIIGRGGKIKGWGFLYKLMDDRVGVYVVGEKSVNWESKIIRNEACV